MTRILATFLFTGYFPFAPATFASLVFGVIHALPAVVVPMVLFGAALAWLCETNGSFFSGLLAHAAFNALTVVQLLLV